MKQIIDIAAPLLLHMAVSELTAFLMGPGSDPALRTAVTSVIVIPAALWMIWQDRAFGRAPERRLDSGKGLLLFAACMVCGAVLNFAWSGVLNRLRVQDFFSNTTQERLLAGQLVIQIIGLGVLVPVAEELIFRVLIYGKLRRLFGAGLSVLFSSLLFAVYHGNVIQMIFAFPMAAVLALIYEKGKWAGYPIAFHMGANLAAVVANML